MGAGLRMHSGKMSASTSNTLITLESWDKLTLLNAEVVLLVVHQSFKQAGHAEFTERKTSASQISLCHE